MSDEAKKPEKYQISDLGSKGWELSIATSSGGPLASGLTYDDAADLFYELNTLAAENARLRDALDWIIERAEKDADMPVWVRVYASGVLRNDPEIVGKPPTE